MVFLNNDTRVQPGWLSALVAPFANPTIGAIQPKLLFPDGTIQTFGTVLGAQGHVPYELYRGLPGDAPHLNAPRTLAMISGACLAIRAVDFATLHGFDPIFINGQEDNDLCLRLRARLGKTCRVEPSSIVIHHEGGTPGRGRFAYGNRRTFVERWKDELKRDDAEIYRRDGYAVRLYAPDVAEWASAGLASFRPVLERTDVTRGSALPAAPISAGLSDFSIAIKIACPSEAVREEWGDYHFARSLSEALLRLGCRSRIDYLRSWDDQDDCDLDLVLRGLERFRPRPGRPALLWVISHPDLVSVEELREYDHVFVASRRLARRWAGESGVKVEPLLQCTDRRLFFPDPSDAPRNRDILFVGNSRNVFRPAMQATVGAGLVPTVYGTRWETLIDPGYIKGTLIPNAVVGDLYRKAGVVLNDHWPDMREAGILSNRVFDALACGAPVVSDEIADLPDGFADFINEFGPRRPIDGAIATALIEDAQRRAARRTFADTVRQEHSFDRRAETILACAKALIAGHRQARSSR